jgi:hypothetical protein
MTSARKLSWKIFPVALCFLAGGCYGYVMPDAGDAETGGEDVDLHDTGPESTDDGGGGEDAAPSDPTDPDFSDPDLPVDGPEDEAPPCPGELVLCSEECVNTQTNHDHCGECDHDCEAAEFCSDGDCVLECEGGTTPCGGDCVDTSTDIFNCDTCDHECPSELNADPVCTDGVCGLLCHAGWIDTDGNGSCETWCIPTGPDETCNGADDDCDGSVDEGFDCAAGEEVFCVNLCGETGVGACTGSCTFPDPASCSGPLETCNGLDDDCDGGCDEAFACCSGESGGCTTSCFSSGTRTCGGGCAWGACQPPAETCNGVDDDCDGTCDDGFGCCAGRSQSCVTACGDAGSAACDASCVLGRCLIPSQRYQGNDSRFRHSVGYECDTDWCACVSGLLQEGPDISLAPGPYRVSFYIGVSVSITFDFDVYDAATSTVLASETQTYSSIFTHNLDFTAPSGCHALEFRVTSHTAQCTRIYDVTLTAL